MTRRVYSNFNNIPRGQAKDVLTSGCLVLEGGALRGLYTAGVLDELMMHDINFDCVIGTSAGALTGINYISGQIGRTARMNIAFRHDNRYIGIPATLKNKGVIGFDFLLDEYNNFEQINEEAFNNPKRRFLACCTNCDTGETEYFERGVCDKFLDACKASASMPYVSSMVEINGYHYLDGGCSCKIPFQWALDNGFKKIVVVRTRDINYRKTIKDRSKENKLIYRSYPKFAEALDNMNANYNIQCEQLEELEKEQRIFMIKPNKPVEVSRLEGNVQKLGELYEAGRQDALEQLDELIKYLER